MLDKKPLSITGALGIRSDRCPCQRSRAPTIRPSGFSDRAVELVIDNFHDVSALDRFSEAVRQQVQDPIARPRLQVRTAELTSAIAAVLASLQASHTGHFQPDTIDYFELAVIFRSGFRNDFAWLFPPEGEVTYPGIGMIPNRTMVFGSLPKSMTARRRTVPVSLLATKS